MNACSAERLFNLALKKEVDCPILRISLRMRVEIMEVSSDARIQDGFLTEAQNRQTCMVIYMMNGFQMRGKVIGFDDYSILVESDGKQQLLYKHAVSTLAVDTQRPDFQKELSGHNIRKPNWKADRSEQK